MDEMESLNIGASNFSFSATKIDELGATEYTLVSIVVDKSSSVSPFADLLLKMVKTIIESCKKSPRAENLMIRLLYFSSKNQLEEVHGFKLLNSINTDDYKDIRPCGCTALVDASFSAIGSTLTYAKNLIDQDFDVNGIIFIITDGQENDSTMTMDSVQKQIAESRKQENIESLQTILIGVTDDDQISSYLQGFKDEAGLDDYKDAGEATKESLAKIANFASQSVSSVSQSLQQGPGSVAASQPLTI